MIFLVQIREDTPFRDQLGEDIRTRHCIEFQDYSWRALDGEIVGIVVVVVVMYSKKTPQTTLGTKFWVAPAKCASSKISETVPHIT